MQKATEGDFQKSHCRGICFVREILPRPLQPPGAPIVFLQKLIDGAAGPEYNKANT